MKDVKNKLLPDWERGIELYFVWPENLKAGHNGLIPFYQRLLKTIQQVSEKLIHVLTTCDPAEASGKYNLGHQVIFHHADVKDIWIRDFAPLQVRTAEEYVLVKQHYAPFYFKRNDQEYAKAGNELTKNLNQLIKKRVIQLGNKPDPLIIDGGNPTVNGDGMAITTDRIISDNRSYAIEEIRRIFKEKLGISELIVLPVEPGDVTGHVDGMVRFISRQVVVVADYPEEYPEGRKFYNTIASSLTDKGLTVVRLLNAIPLETKGFPPATGNYINFLRIENKILLPRYKGQESLFNKAKATLESYVSEVIGIDCDLLAKKGGVLNCISYHDHVEYRMDLRKFPKFGSDEFSQIRFAHTFNGYQFSDELPRLLQRSLNYFIRERKVIPEYSAEELRAVLFFAYRALKFSDYPMSEKEQDHLDSIVRVIQRKALKQITGFETIEKPMMQFSIGGYTGTNYQLTTDYDVVLLRVKERVCQEQAQEYIFKPTKDEWGRFLFFLQHKVRDVWKKDYSDNGIQDGTQWELRFRYKHKAFTYYGSNDYPENFKEFLNELKTITGGSKLS